MNAPYTMFGETLILPVRVYVGGRIDPSETEWDADLWVEDNTDWYALMSPQLRDKRVRIIDRGDWLWAKRAREDRP